MPERLRKQVLGRLPRGWLLGCGISLAALPVLGAESLPASVRACSTISDSTERLSCYDREVASFPVPEAKAVGKSVPGAAGGGVGNSAVAAVSGTSQAAASGNGVGNRVAAPGGGSEGGNGLAANSHAASSNAAASSGTNPAAPAGSGAGSQAAASGSGVGNDAVAAGASGSGHISAHLVRIERFPNEMVFHLDNGQVWQELQSVPGDLSLREGDAVKIDLHWGSYWLSGPHVYSMKVRLKT